MRGLDCKRLELDELWCYIGKKMRHVKEDDDPTMGDVWTYCAIDAETKLVPSYHVSSRRNRENTVAFLSDLASRLNNRVRIPTDAMNAYEDAIESAFGRDVSLRLSILLSFPFPVRLASLGLRLGILEPVMTTG